VESHVVSVMQGTCYHLPLLTSCSKGIPCKVFTSTIQTSFASNLMCFLYFMSKTDQISPCNSFHLSG